MGGQIIIENLSYSYSRNKPVLQELSGAIPAGSIFGLVGKNGSGKTTLFGLILGMLHPEEGGIRVLDQDGHTLPPGAVGFLPERPYYHGEFRLLEYLKHLTSFSLQPCNMREIEKIIERVALEGYEKEYLRGFSKGMLQRVGIAQALLQRPCVLILDEPMSGLDPFGQKLMREIIHKIHKEGTTILISSHNLYEIERNTTLVGVLHREKLRILDPKEAKTYRSVYIQVEGAHIDLKIMFADLSSVVICGHSITFPFSQELYGQIMLRICKANVVIRHLQIAGDDLESIALNYLGEDDEHA